VPSRGWSENRTIRTAHQFLVQKVVVRLTISEISCTLLEIFLLLAPVVVGQSSRAIDPKAEDGTSRDHATLNPDAYEFLLLT
jgi:hypothetical protein